MKTVTISKTFITHYINGYPVGEAPMPLRMEITETKVKIPFPKDCGHTHQYLKALASYASAEAAHNPVASIRVSAERALQKLVQAGV